MKKTVLCLSFLCAVIMVGTLALTHLSGKEEKNKVIEAARISHKEESSTQEDVPEKNILLLTTGGEFIEQAADYIGGKMMIEKKNVLKSDYSELYREVKEADLILLGTELTVEELKIMFSMIKDVEAVQNALKEKQVSFFLLSPEHVDSVKEAQEEGEREITEMAESGFDVKVLPVIFLESQNGFDETVQGRINGWLTTAYSGVDVR